MKIRIEAIIIILLIIAIIIIPKTKAVDKQNYEVIDLNPLRDATELPTDMLCLYPLKTYSGKTIIKNESRPYSISGKINTLIYHTHLQEAYRIADGDSYKKSSEWRTLDRTKSIVAVGDALQSELEKYGFTVLHDDTDHEPPSLSTAYERSEVTMKKYLDEYPSLEFFIDLHRDAADVEKKQNDFVVIDGKECARIMFVVGKGEKYDDKPDFDKHMKIVTLIMAELESMCKGFTRPIHEKTGRYNQHIGEICLLIEVGHNANTLKQAKNSMPYLAKAISNVISAVPFDTDSDYTQRLLVSSVY